ncbi:MAG TPA: Ig-like domain-containing protein [Patescibacteria group bacterium]|nr:Ig-like domain-containing protein [Patescibacteria group bacterium]
MSRKWKIIIAGVVIFIVIIIISFLTSTQKNQIQGPLTITSSVPSNQASNVNVFDPITITFNQNINPALIGVTSTPNENWSISQNSPATITINHTLYLQENTSYQLSINQSGVSIGILNFKTAQDQNDPRQLQQLQSDLNKDYPLASLTPYETADFKVVYSAPLTLEIDLKSAISSQDAISQVKTWVSTNGVDPSTHTYRVVPSK